MGKATKKIISLGLGVAVITKEKAEKLAKELQKKGAVSARQGKKLVKYILEESDKAQTKILDIIDVQARNIIKKVPLITRKDLFRAESKLIKKARKGVKRKKGR